MGLNLKTFNHKHIPTEFKDYSDAYMFARFNWLHMRIIYVHSSLQDQASCKMINLGLQLLSFAEFKACRTKFLTGRDCALGSFSREQAIVTKGALWDWTEFLPFRGHGIWLKGISISSLVSETALTFC